MGVRADGVDDSGALPPGGGRGDESARGVSDGNAIDVSNDAGRALCKCPGAWAHPLGSPLGRDRPRDRSPGVPLGEGFLRSDHLPDPPFALRSERNLGRPVRKGLGNSRYPSTPGSGDPPGLKAPGIALR